MKKVFIFSSLGLALLLFFWGIYSLLFKPASENSSSSITSKATTTTENRPTATEKMALLTDEPILDPALNEDSSALKYYVEEL